MGYPPSLLETNDFVIKKKILSLSEHYEFEDSSGTKLSEADGNFFQFPAKFTAVDTHGLELMHLEGKKSLPCVINSQFMVRQVRNWER